MRKTGPGSQLRDDKSLRQRLTQVSKCRTCPKIYPGMYRLTISKQWHMLARMAAASIGRVVSMIGSETDRVACPHYLLHLRKPVVSIPSRLGIPLAVPAMAPHHINFSH